MNKPDWIKTKLKFNKDYITVRNLLRRKKLNTVCQSALCPNIGECFGNGTATFMILGNTCTRNCTFCNIKNEKVESVDENEPRRIAEAVKTLKLSYVVITSVTRDDLIDGGAEHFSRTTSYIRQYNPQIKVEVLIPDFKGKDSSLKIVKKAMPDVINHNIETVERLYPEVRPQADYFISLMLLKNIKSDSNITSKSGLMVGLGESMSEIKNTLEDLRKVNVDIVTIGQYLAPSENHHKIIKYYTPDEFEHLKKFCENIGFKKAVSDPLVRSSYHAEEAFMGDQ